MSTFYKTLAKLNKAILPSYSKRGLDLTQATKFQLAIIGYRTWVTKRALG
ncbi:SsrA-binding protein [Dokdonia sp. LLG6352-1]